MNIWQINKLTKKKQAQIAVFSKLLSELYDESWYGYFTEDEIQFFFSYIKDKRILVLDDNPIDLEVFDGYLKFWGCRYQNIEFR